MAILTVTPGGLTPESIGFVQACVGLVAEPTQSIMITLQTVDGNAQGTLFFICKITILQCNMNFFFYCILSQICSWK